MKKLILILLILFTIFGCTRDGNDASSNEAGSIDGQGGSLAKFTLKGDYLYTVDVNQLSTFSILKEDNPVKVNEQYIGFDIETLFGYKDYLYIGSESAMFIYDITNPEFPQELSRVSHFTACDPVVANDTHAFVTLHSNAFCGNNINVLEVYDVAEVTEPILISSRNLTQPKGLGLYGNYLIVCDDEIKVFDITDPTASKLVNSFDREAFDVIIQNDLLIAIGSGGLYQFTLEKDEDKGISLNQLSELII